jgi:hypothetical protein
MVMGTLPNRQESEDDDGNRWWLRSSDSLDAACPAFLRVGRLDQPGDSEKKEEYKTRKKKKKDKKNNAQNFPVSHDIPHLLLSILQEILRKCTTNARKYPFP